MVKAPHSRTATALMILQSLWLTAAISGTGSHTPASASALQSPSSTDRHEVQKSQWDGVYTTSQAMRGKALYTENCAACHGSELSGGFGPALAGSRFLVKWRGRALNDLFELMRVTMPPTFPGGFDRQQNADVLAFMLQQGNSPAGSAELSGDSEILRQIRILIEKP